MRFPTVSPQAWRRLRYAGTGGLLACGLTTAAAAEPAISAAGSDTTLSERARARAAEWAEALGVAERPSTQLVSILGNRQQGQSTPALQQFTDSAFPARRKSLGIGQEVHRRDWKRKKNWNALEWRRASTIRKGNALFCTPIEPNDIAQGDLGNCYFMAALGALAARGQGDAIRKLFPPAGQHPERGLYTCRLFASGVEHEIEIDDLLPCTVQHAPPGTFFPGYGTTRVETAFANPVRGELWVPLLEKAWAKLHGSYGRTSGGSPGKSLEDLTGAPNYKILTQTLMNKASSSSNEQQLWAILREAEKQRYPCCASAITEAELDKTTRIVRGAAAAAKGLTLQHAYTVMGTYTVPQKYGGQQLVRLRNPHGRHSWQGDWGFGSGKWETPAVKSDPQLQAARRLVGKEKDNGTFYIELADFQRMFAMVNVLMMRDRARYEFLPLNVPADSQQVVATMTVGGGYRGQATDRPRYGFGSMPVNNLTAGFGNAPAAAKGVAAESGSGGNSSGGGGIMMATAAAVVSVPALVYLGYMQLRRAKAEAPAHAAAKDFEGQVGLRRRKKPMQATAGPADATATASVSSSSSSSSASSARRRANNAWADVAAAEPERAGQLRGPGRALLGGRGPWLMLGGAAALVSVGVACLWQWSAAGAVASPTDKKVDPTDAPGQAQQQQQPKSKAKAQQEQKQQKQKVKARGEQKQKEESGLSTVGRKGTATKRVVLSLKQRSGRIVEAQEGGKYRYLGVRLSVIDTESGRLAGATYGCGERDLHLGLDLPAQGSYRVVVEGGLASSGDPAVKNGRTMILSAYSQHNVHLDAASSSYLTTSSRAADADTSSRNWGKGVVRADPSLGQAIATKIFPQDISSHNSSSSSKKKPDRELSTKELAVFTMKAPIKGENLARDGPLLQTVGQPDPHDYIYGYRNTSRRDLELVLSLDSKKKQNSQLCGYWHSPNARLMQRSREDTVTVLLPAGAAVVVGMRQVCLGDAASFPFRQSFTQL